MAPPEGAPVVAVSPRYPSVEEQEARLKAIPLQERQQAFDEYVRLARQGPPPEADVASIKDQELVDMVHEVRAEKAAGQEHARRD
jgi:hypothetical protein